MALMVTLYPPNDPLQVYALGLCIAGFGLWGEALGCACPPLALEIGEGVTVLGVLAFVAYRVWPIAVCGVKATTSFARIR